MATTTKDKDTEKKAEVKTTRSSGVRSAGGTLAKTSGAGSKKSGAGSTSAAAARTSGAGSKTSVTRSTKASGNLFDNSFTTPSSSLNNNTENKQTSKKKKIIMGIICAAIAILILVICLCAKSCNSTSSRNNAYNLARTYAEQGEYDRALSVLDKLLLKNGNDSTALEMLQQIIEMKKAADEAGRTAWNQ